MEAPPPPLPAPPPRRKFEDHLETLKAEFIKASCSSAFYDFKACKLSTFEGEWARALNWALASKQELKEVAALIEGIKSRFGVDAPSVLNWCNPDGNTPLAYAVAAGREGPLKRMLYEGLGVNERLKPDDLDIPLLAIAILSGQERVVQLLLSYGASPWTIPADLWLEDPTSISIGGEKHKAEAEWCSGEMPALLEQKINYPMQ